MKLLMNKCHGHHQILLMIAILTLFPNNSIAADTISLEQPLYANQTLSSANGVFELGFISLPFANLYDNLWYVGVWYKNMSELPVWIANTDTPLISPSQSGLLLTIGAHGNIVILNQTRNNLVWTSSSSTLISNTSTVAQLLDSGNFVIRYENDTDPQNYLWQGFDHPTDTLLPGMKLGWDAKSGVKRQITSWQYLYNDEGNSFVLDPINYNTSFPDQCYLMNNDQQSIQYRTGPWNGIGFSGFPEIVSFDLVKSPDGSVYYTFQVHNTSLYSTLVVNGTSARLELYTYTWIDTLLLSRNLYWYAPKDQCDYFKQCGIYGICNTDQSPICKCITGFQPKNQQAWNLRDGSEGCVRVHELDCKSDGFLKLQGMKLPEISLGHVFVNDSTTITLEDCRKLCLANCSCTAYANSKITGSGCAIWSSDLIDMRKYSDSEGGQNLYVRVAAIDADTSGNNQDSKTKRILWTKKTKIILMAAGVATGGSVAVVVSLILFFTRRKKLSSSKKKGYRRASLTRRQGILFNAAAVPSRKKSSSGHDESTTEELELPLYDFTSISAATNHFANANKLGEGGFGSVYKGVLDDGQEIAVKRLSKYSGQGVEEFRNEVRLIAKLQHRNLVRLVGCCIDTEEKILMYEYMEHKSLDLIVFNKEKSMLLNWKSRYSIICGIARGILYLHQDSILKIIHRDLKASNILLDKEMIPKISDFGMARIFKGDQMDANTKRIVGTYGYMAPEYAMDGVFSDKTDVFSFGVLLLEIVSGTKNRGFYFANNQENLLAYVWRLWTEGRGVDSAAGQIDAANEINRCIQVGLLCVQEQTDARPNMATVVLLLLSSSGNTPLPQPKHPGYCLGRKPSETADSSLVNHDATANDVTITNMDAR